MNHSASAEVLHEAFTRYLGVDTFSIANTQETEGLEKTMSAQKTLLLRLMKAPPMPKP